MARMKAYAFTRYGGSENEAFLDLPVLEPGRGELLVRVVAAGVRPGARSCSGFGNARTGLRGIRCPDGAA